MMCEFIWWYQLFKRHTKKKFTKKDNHGRICSRDEKGHTRAIKNTMISSIFLEVRGKRKEGGWIRNDSVSYKIKDNRR